jgi:RNA polymerase sigma-70 factor (ECF subfamily)
MSVSSENDEVLMRRYADGDVAAFTTLYRRHELRVWRYLQRNVPSLQSAEEVMQEVWFAVARDAARYQPTARFTTWLFTIAHNRMIDWVRGKHSSVSLDGLGFEADAVVEQLTADSAQGPFAAAVSCDQAAALLRAVERLPPEQRSAFLLQVEGDLSIEEIAAITDSSFETTKSRLRYARAKLRELLKEYA